MTSETSWRRTWKPDLRCTPWTPIVQEGKTFLFKFHVSANTYEFMFTDNEATYIETADEAKIVQRTQKLNPSVEAPVHKLLDHIGQHMNNPTTSKITTKVSEERCTVCLETKLAGLPFLWRFNAHPCPQQLVSDHVTLPLMGMVAELFRRQSELHALLYRKDKEIDDYKAQGAKVTRKHLQTAPFDETAFRDSMNTSQEFESEAGRLGENTYNHEGKQLYTDLMTKHAWLAHKHEMGDRVATKTSPQKAGGASNTGAGESWNARVPGSVVSPSVSPTKNANTTSPDKRGESPPKDSELLRRQALERRLAEEEGKKEQKKKKKKLKL